MENNNKTSEENRNGNKEILEWVEAVVIAVILAVVIRSFLFEFIRVDGPSMQPTLYTGEQLMVNKIGYRFNTPKRGDVVICNYPSREDNYVKRIIALSGETVEIHNGKLYINGNYLKESYIKEPIAEDFAQVKVPDNSVMVMGDNRNNSMDSRDPTVGPILKSSVLGKAECIVWPFNKMKSLIYKYN